MVEGTLACGEATPQSSLTTWLSVVEGGGGRGEGGGGGRGEEERGKERQE